MNKKMPEVGDTVFLAEGGEIGHDWEVNEMGEEDSGSDINPIIQRVVLIRYRARKK